MALLSALAVLLSLSLPLVAQSQETRRNEKFGIALEPPRDWEWTAPIGDQIAVRMKVEVDGHDEEVTGELFCTRNGFVGARIDELQAEAKRNPADHKDFDIDEGERLGEQRDVAVIKYVKERGTDPVRLYDRRHWLFRRYGILYEWKEEWPRRCSRARSALSAVHRAFDFFKPEGAEEPDSERDYVNQRVKFRLPKDWEWSEGPSGRRIEIDASQGGKILFTVRSELVVKGRRWSHIVNLQALETSGTPEQIIGHNFDQTSLSKNWKNIEEYQVDTGVRLRGEKAQLVSYIAVPQSGGSEVRFLSRHYVFKHKGHVFIWYEQVPVEGAAAAAPAFKKAQNSLLIY